jgi:chorismate synthase
MEADKPHIISGLYNGFTTGAPLTIMFLNENIRSSDYSQFKAMPRPGHADYTASQKYGGFNDPRGGGHFSGRLTLGLVAVGVIAKKIIDPINIRATVSEAGGSTCVDRIIEQALQENDLVGGLIACTVTNVPVGLGEPFFDSVESVLAHGLFSIPAIKGVEFGAGFAAAKMKGSEHNDAFVSPDGKTATNNAGGINGGISNGNNLVFRVAVKPASSIGHAQQTFNFETNKMDTLEIQGRHDTCIALRMPVIVEAVTAIVLADFTLLNHK